jgi:hypothetical protein
VILPSIADLCIHPEYQQRAEPSHFDDRDQRDLWQDDVYAWAKDYAVEESLGRVLDFGCGSGYKLMKYFSAADTVGYEVEPSLSYLANNYPDRDWQPASTDGRFVGDLLLCVDVIEHLVDPLPLMHKLRRGPLQRVILSTPALEILAERGESPRLGPPNNESHAREWTTREFRDFVEMHLRVEEHVVFARQGTQMILARLR